MESHTPSTPVAVHHSTIPSTGLCLAILAGALFAPALSLQAATATWNGGSASSANWSIAGNWGTALTAPGSTSSTTNTDTAIFNSAIGNTWGNSAINPVVIDSTSQNIKSITFDSSAGSYFIGSTSGNLLLLSSGGTIQITASVAAGVTETINAPLKIEGNYTFQNNNANAGTTLNFGGGIASGAASGTTTLTLTGTNTGANTISGIIANGSTAATAITKSGSGTWVLSGVNTYTGATIINSGSLKIGTNNAISSSSALTINNNTGGTTTLDLNGFNQSFTTIGIAGAGATATSVNQIVGSGTLSLIGTLTVNASGQLESTISTTALDFGGGQSTLYVNNSVNAPIDLTVSAVIQNGKLNKNGTGTLLLTGVNTYGGGTINQGSGTILLGNNSALGTGTLTMNPGSTIASSDATARVLTNAVNTTNSTGGGTFGTAGSGDLTFGGLTVGTTQTTGTLVVNNANTTFSSIAGNGSGTFYKQGTGALLVNGNSTLANTTYDIQGGMLGVAGSMTANNLKLDGGVIGLSGTYSKALGTTTAGSVQWASSASGGFAAYGSNATWGNAANNLAVNIGGAGATYTFGSTANFLSSGQALILGNASSNGTVDFQNGLNLNGTTQTVQVEHAIANTAKGVDAVLSGTISNGGLVKTGSGTLKLSAANTYSGATSVNAGKLLVTGSLSATSSVSVASTAELSVAGLINQSATITLNGKLTGTGTVGAVAVGATGVVSAGDDSIGTLKTGDFTLASTSSVTFDLTSGNTAIGGGINDLIAIAGNLTLDGTLVVNSGEALANGRYTLFTYTGALTNNTMDLSPTFLSTYEGSYIDTSIGNQVALVVVPEPSTWAFLAGGLGLLAFVQRLRYGKENVAF